MSLYLIKRRILIRMRFIAIKSLHVMYYLPFDRSMGLWIINEFLKEHINITSTTFSIHNDKFEKKLLFMDKSLMRRGDALFDQQILQLYEYSFRGYEDLRALKEDWNLHYCYEPIGLNCWIKIKIKLSIYSLGKPNETNTRYSGIDIFLRCLILDHVFHGNVLWIYLAI